MAAAGEAATDLGAVAYGPRPATHGLGGRKEGGDCGAPQVQQAGFGAVSDRIPLALGPACRTGIPMNGGREPLPTGCRAPRQGWGWHLRPLRASQSVPPYLLISRGGPRQARRPLFCCGGHRAGAAALVENHGDLPGLVALLRDQWAECPAGETLTGAG